MYGLEPTYDYWNPHHLPNYYRAPPRILSAYFNNDI